MFPAYIVLLMGAWSTIPNVTSILNVTFPQLKSKVNVKGENPLLLELLIGSFAKNMYQMVCTFYKERNLKFDEQAVK